jgi:hypothetical protein
VAAFPALSAISGGESFEDWLITSDTASASGTVLSTPAKSGGLAFATYRHRPSSPAVPVASVNEPLLVGTILYGVTGGGDGVIIVGRPIHIGAHGPLIGKLLGLVGV